MKIVLRWYYNGRDNPKPIIPELTGTIGPFDDEKAAEAWIEKADKWGGWGEYKYEIVDLFPPNLES